MDRYLHLAKTFAGHQRDVNSVAFSRDETLLASGGGDRTIRLWSVPNQQLAHMIDHGEWVNAVSFAPGAPVVASAGRDGFIKLWRTDNAQSIGNIQSHPDNATAVTFSPDGLRIVSGGQEGKVRFFNLRDKKVEADVAAHAGWVWRVTFSTGGDRLLSAGADAIARIWRLGSRDKPLTLEGHESEVLYAAFSPDDRFVVTAGKDGVVKFWDSERGQLFYTFKAHDGAVNSVNFSTSGAHLLTAGADRFVRIWNAESGELSGEIEAGFDYVSECVFSKSGKSIATCGGDGLVKMWTMSDQPSTVEVAEVEHKRVIPDVPDGKDIKRDPLLETGPLTIPQGQASGPRLHRILARAVKEKASDVHVPSGAPIQTRMHGRLKVMEGESFPKSQIESMLMEILTDEQQRRFRETNDLDFSYEIPGVGRFRANICRQHRGVDGTFRIVPDYIPSAEELGLPAIVPTLTRHHQGLVLITGPAGQGKSTTIATLVALINNEKPLHIITVEDPIEFVHPIQKAVVNQREVGKHTLAFANALRAALREDPDVIVVGEMRDLETISLAITAAETGHLVFASLMTTDAAQTIDRILDSFPAGQQAQIRTMLSESLKGIICQQLVPTADGAGRVLACEILICNLAVGNMIRERKTVQLGSVMQTNRNVGMQRMDDALFDLFQSGRITQADAQLYSHDSKAMDLRFKTAGSAPPAAVGADARARR